LAGIVKDDPLKTWSCEGSISQKVEHDDEVLAIPCGFDNREPQVATSKVQHRRL